MNKMQPLHRLSVYINHTYSCILTKIPCRCYLPGSEEGRSRTGCSHKLVSRAVCILPWAAHCSTTLFHVPFARKCVIPMQMWHPYFFVLLSSKEAMQVDTVKNFSGVISFIPPITHPLIWRRKYKLIPPTLYQPHGSTIYCTTHKTEAT